MAYELAFLLKEVGDTDVKVDKTGIRGLVVAKTGLNPIEAVQKLRALLQERPYEFRYALRIIPVEKVVRTDLEQIKETTAEIIKSLNATESFRVTLEKRFTNMHSLDLIEAVTMNIKNKVDLKNPDKILLIEVLGGFTGVALVKPTDIISVMKEKML